MNRVIFIIGDSMKNKVINIEDENGFTLIELLAVIVILGILMIVAIPQVTKYIENSKKNTYADTAKSYIDSARYMLLNDDFTTANNKESYISISDIKFALSDSVKSAYHKCKNVIDSYGQRAKAAASNDGSDLKALSHCVRVLLQVEELIETGKIVFPLKHADFIKSIKYNTSHLTGDEIMEWIEKKIEYINVQLEKSTLREKADFNWIKNFILTCYK